MEEFPGFFHTDFTQAPVLVKNGRKCPQKNKKPPGKEESFSLKQVSGGTKEGERAKKRGKIRCLFLFFWEKMGIGEKGGKKTKIREKGENEEKTKKRQFSFENCRFFLVRETGLEPA